MTTEILTITGRPQTLSHALWKRFGRRTIGLVEATYDLNPGLADLGPLLPLGTKVKVSPPAPTRTTKVVRLIRLTGR